VDPAIWTDGHNNHSMPQRLFSSPLPKVVPVENLEVRECLIPIIKRLKEQGLLTECSIH
jgi:hypothetical protein